MNTKDGVYTHGVNRFVPFIKMVENGLVFPNNEPVKIHAINALEQWDGQLAPAVLNAIKATDGAIRLAKTNGVGCVALANT